MRPHTSAYEADHQLLGYPATVTDFHGHLTNTIWLKIKKEGEQYGGDMIVSCLKGDKH